MAANVIRPGDPQAGQKARVFTLPLSPTMSQCAASLAISTCVRGRKVRSIRLGAAGSRGTGSHSRRSLR
jgi:hypothetical protein